MAKWVEGIEHGHVEGSDDKLLGVSSFVSHLFLVQYFVLVLFFDLTSLFLRVLLF